ncbi:MAG TPA: isoprenylcysteine carboxylmethyltransferase family protein [Candidatus Aminicenantes bacterium]|nr:isoprenylcysteine carboxylmethyltransferase family protein [Candidatus Aminicenantes bacterium]HQF98172.1 isoprenylcysteine carboxylmethyltransferase family protein [Candidatus Aminicenantes bacterium]
MKLKTLVGSGDKIARSVLPVIIIGLALNVWRPSIFSVGGPSPVLKIVSIALLVPGVVVWARSVALILRKVPRKELITTGPYAIVKHPLYTGAAFFVLPWLGFLFNSWLGVAGRDRPLCRIPGVFASRGGRSGQDVRPRLGRIPSQRQAALAVGMPAVDRL